MVRAMFLVALLLASQSPSRPPERPRKSAGEEMRAELAPAADPYAEAARAWGACVRARAGEAAAAGTAEAAAIEAGLAACAAEEAALGALWAGEFDASRAARMMAEYREAQRGSALRYLRQARRGR